MNYCMDCDKPVTTDACISYGGGAYMCPTCWEEYADEREGWDKFRDRFVYDPITTVDDRWD